MDGDREEGPAAKRPRLAATGNGETIEEHIALGELDNLVKEEAPPFCLYVYMYI